MSIACMTRVWEHSEQKGSDLLLLLAIADYADDNGFAWPGVETLAAKTRLTSRHLFRVIAKLKDAKELIAIERPGRSNLYIVTPGATQRMLDAAVQRAADFGADVDSNPPDIMSYLPQTTPDKLSPTPDKSGIVPLTPMSPDPSRTTNEPPEFSPDEKTKDDDWLSESRIVPLGESEPPSDGIPADPLVHALQAAQGKQQNWAVPPDAGGYDDFTDEPLAAFCKLVGISPETLPQKKRNGWAKELRGVAEEWGVGPPIVAACIQRIPDSEYHWKTYSSPYQDSFKVDLGTLIGQALTEQKYGPQPKVVELRLR